MMELKDIVLDDLEPRETWKEFRRYSENWTERKSSALLSNALETPLKGNSTFGEFLYGSKGYFDKNQEVYAIVFVDRKFAIKLSREEYSLFDGYSEQSLGEQHNAVPLCFERPREDLNLEIKSEWNVLACFGFAPACLPLPRAQ